MFGTRTLLVFAVIASVLLSGCASKQELSRFSGARPQNVCIAKNSAVKEGVLSAIDEGFRVRGSKIQVVSATYDLKHGLLQPTIVPAEVVNCDAIVFYSANWHWDLAMYMRFANIWITDRSTTKKLAQATYQAGAGPDKFIDAKKKILELINGLFVSTGEV